MPKSLLITLIATLTVITGTALFIAWKVGQVADSARSAVWNISALAYNANPTVQNVNTATGVWAKASQKQADAADELIKDLRVESWHLDTTLTNLNSQASHVGPMLDSLKGESDQLQITTAAATGFTQEATRTVQTMRTGTGPLLDAYTASGRDLDAFIQENLPVIHSNLQHSDELLAAFAVTASDFHVWSHPILNPEPCKTFGCKLGRYGWPIAKAALGIGATGREAFGVPVPVSIQH